ncbi:hypothetical protein [Streptomyces gibsoniae]|uniref:Uncharacterized protein n=1 Tax=Streptomyces gibsoniae TaxID=3075529 RepID=A0ABU2UA33_9ACTN|nr:hypothetical protein [Streptomyces sp. DSM 41699]MDT0470104.1 hypothetical protein [Streptomyces sp. DSM 41699]
MSTSTICRRVGITGATMVMGLSALFGQAYAGDARPAATTASVRSAVSGDTQYRPYNDANKIFTLRDGKCMTEGSFKALYGAYIFGYSQRFKGGCWHWVRVWIHNYDHNVNYILKNQGTKQFLQTPFASTGNYYYKKGNMPYAAEFGLCGSAGHCVTKKVKGVTPNW